MKFFRMPYMEADYGIIKQVHHLLTNVSSDYTSCISTEKNNVHFVTANNAPKDNNLSAYHNSKQRI